MKLGLCVLSIALLVGCHSEELRQGLGLVTSDVLTYCCDPDDPPPSEGYYVGSVILKNLTGVALDVDPVSATLTTQPMGRQVVKSLTTITFDLYSGCVKEDQTIAFSFPLPQHYGRQSDIIETYTVTVKWDCPDAPPDDDPPGGGPLATYFALCSPTAPGVPDILAITSRASPSPLSALAGADGIFGPDEEFVVAGTGGGSCCSLSGGALQSVISLDFYGGRALPEVAGKAAPAIFFHGNAIFAFSAWVPANNAFGMISLGGGFDNWTDVAPSGEENATDHYLLVGNSGSRIRPIIPLDFVPQWGLGSFDIVLPTMFQAAWGKPVTCARPERHGDIVVACELNLTDAGNLIVVSMGGDDTADSSALVGQTGKQPRRLRSKGGIYGVTCFGENLLSLFRRTATGFEKIGDAVVGDGPLDLDVKRLLNGDVAFLCTGSRDNTWSVVVVNPTTGEIVSTTTEPVPDEIEEPTSCVWADAQGNVYILGRTSRNIALFDPGVE